MGVKFKIKLKIERFLIQSQIYIISYVHFFLYFIPSHSYF